MKKIVTVFIFSLIGIGLSVTVSSAESRHPDWPVHLRILAGPERGQWYAMSGSISEILSREVIPSSYRKGGGISNLENLNNKFGDLGFSLTSFFGGAASGAPEYMNIRTKNVSVIGNVYPQVLYFLIRTDFARTHGIKSLEDLMRLRSPVRLALLKKGTASEFFVRVLFKYGYGTNYAELRKKGWTILFNGYSATADSFVAGGLDCFAYTAGTHVPLLLDLENYTKFTALPISEEVLGKLGKMFKFGSYVIDPHVYKGINAPVKTLSDFTCMAVRRELPDDLVYEILKSLWRHKKDISETLIEFNEFSPSTSVPKGIVLHPGAKKFWQEFQH